MSLSRAAICSVALSLLLVCTPAGFAAPPQSTCDDPALPLTAEEQRLRKAVPQEVLRRSGFDTVGQQFRQRLCEASGFSEAQQVVTTEADALWRMAVARVQQGSATGGLPAEDDRPLYWARLTMTSALRQWTPSFDLSPTQRDDLLWSLERHSRGQESVDFPPGDGVKRVLVSGFDPFQLDSDIRRSNPSGAAALALDGVTVPTPTGPARIEAAMFPVLWKPFEQGMVERTFLPHLRSRSAPVDTFATVSQGRPDRFDIEHYNGRWHQGLDNNNEIRQGVIEVPPGVPTLVPAPEFVPTTQPYGDIVRADTGRFPVFHNPQVVEIPAGQTEPVVRPDGPTPGSTAREGGGGSYLSNEIAYRTTLLRDAVGAKVRGGHVHTPVLNFGPGNDASVTDPVFEANLRDIVDQVEAIVSIAAGAPGDAPVTGLPRSPLDHTGRLPKPSN